MEVVRRRRCVSGVSFFSTVTEGWMLGVFFFAACNFYFALSDGWMGRAMNILMIPIVYRYTDTR
jgi:hypothetical protein